MTIQAAQFRGLGADLSGFGSLTAPAALSLPFAPNGAYADGSQMLGAAIGDCFMKDPLLDNPLVHKPEKMGRFQNALARLAGRVPVLGGADRFGVSMDFDQFTPSPRTRRKSPPIVFFKPKGENTVEPAIACWINSLRSLGYKIKFITSSNKLYEQLAWKRTGILLLSTLKDDIPMMVDIIKFMREKKKNPITILGGKGAVPQFAKYVDYVGMGEGDILLPTLLKFLLEKIAAEGIDAARPENAADDLSRLCAERTVKGPDEKQFPIHTNFSQKLFYRDGASYSTPIGDDLTTRFLADVRRWGEFYPESNFSLTLRQYRIATSPIPIGESEIDRLFAVPRRKVMIGDPWFFGNRGCIGNCIYCSVGGETGRRPSVEAVIEYMKASSSSSMKRFYFGDDLFIQNKAWVMKLLDEIEKNGLHKKFRIYVQTRVDCAPMDIIRRMKGLGFRIAVGVESLNPERIERMGKVPKGKGEWYVRKARKLIEELSKLDTEMLTKAHGTELYSMKSTFFIMMQVEGDTILDIAEEIKLQFEICEHILNTYGVMLDINYITNQIPHMVDHSSVTSSGFPYSQPDKTTVNDAIFMPDEKLTVQVGDTFGDFHELGARDHSDGMVFDGIYVPQQFYASNDIAALLDYVRLQNEVYGGSGNSTLGPLINFYVALANAAKKYDGNRKDELNDRLKELSHIFSRACDYVKRITEVAADVIEKKNEGEIDDAEFSYLLAQRTLKLKRSTP